MTTGERLATNLQELIQQQQISTIAVYQFSNSKKHSESTTWSFGHEFIQVDANSYNLNRVIKYNIDSATLAIYL